MAVKFKTTLKLDATDISILGTDFQKTIQLALTGEVNHLADDLDVMKHLTYALHRETQQRMPFRYLLIKLFNHFDYFIESASGFDPAYLERFALALQLHLRLRRLVVNGRDLAIPLWRRNLEYWLRLIFVEVLPLAAMLLSVYFMPALFRANPLPFLFFLFLVLYLLRFLGKGIWMASALRLVPGGYFKSLMAARRFKNNLFDNFWIKLLGASQLLREEA